MSMNFSAYDMACLALGMVLSQPMQNLADAGEMPEIRIAQATASDSISDSRTVVGIAASNAQSLPFHVTVAWHCPTGTRRQQLFVTAADAWRIDNVTEVPSPQTLQLDVPLRQMQWLTQTESACRSLEDQRPPDEGISGGIHYFRLAPGAAAYATVSCVAEAGAPAMATSSAPLDVWLSCPAEAGEETSP